MSSANNLFPSTKNGVNHDKVAILDAGAFYANVVNRKVRELGVESDILSLNTATAFIRSNNYRGIIITGGPNLMNADQTTSCDSDIFKLKIPILGICHGMELILQEFGGKVWKKNISDDGQQNIEIETSCPLFCGLSRQQEVLFTHATSLEQVADKFKIGGWSSNRNVAAIYNNDLKIYGVQFHPEVDLTINGKHILSNFLYGICEIMPRFTIANRKEECIKYIKDKVGHNQVLVLVSGGVDSSLCAALLRHALQPNQIIAVHVDNGFMRENESEKVAKLLRDMGLDLIVRKEAKTFFEGTTQIPIEGQFSLRETDMLCQTFDPEDKRHIIGDVFVKITNEIISEMKLKPEQVILVQGTLRTTNVDYVKRAHNDTDLIRELRNAGRVLEPLRNFYKDEVRQLAYDLGLPAELVERQPFPGPGLAVRILCAEEPYIDKDYPETQVLARVIVDYKNKLDSNDGLVSRVTGVISQHEQQELLRISSDSHLQATVLPVRSVGIQGHKRTYSYAVGLSSRCDPNWNDLLFLAKLMPRILHNVNRVCFIFGKPVQYQVTDITHTTLNVYSLNLLREADSIVNEIIMEADLNRKISQMPVVLIPVHFDRDPRNDTPSCYHSIVLRPFITNDFVTGVPATPGSPQLPLDVLDNMVTKISDLDGVSRALYDLTSKPPGTTEWE